VSLSPEQVSQFRERGYLTGVPALSTEEVAEVRENFERIRGMLPPGERIHFLSQWHKKNDFIFKVCSNPRILDSVEDLIGPDFYLWDAYFFVKDPHENVTSQWHQDMAAWPMTEGPMASVFLAVTDCERSNGCLRVVPQSHLSRRRHVLPPASSERSGEYLFNYEVPDVDVAGDDVAYLELAAGEVSFHHQWMLHGSGPNMSGKLRVGLAMRYAAFDVSADSKRWPGFSIIPMRGEDRYGKSKVVSAPTEYGYPTAEDEPHYRVRGPFERFRGAVRRRIRRIIS